MIKLVTYQQKDEPVKTLGRIIEEDGWLDLIIPPNEFHQSIEDRVAAASRINTADICVGCQHRDYQKFVEQVYNRARHVFFPSRADLGFKNRDIGNFIYTLSYEEQLQDRDVLGPVFAYGSYHERIMLMLPSKTSPTVEERIMLLAHLRTVPLILENDGRMNHDEFYTSVRNIALFNQ